MAEESKEQTVDLQKLLEAEKKRSEDYLTRLKYLQADFENLKKRMDRQIEEVKSYCTERLVVQLLDVQDELEMALKTAQQADSAQPLIEGVQMTLKKLRKVLEQEGVCPIECESGKVFDPSCHQVIATIEQDGVEENVVVEEVRRGYRMKGKVIRPSIVKVSKSPKSLKSQKEAEEREQH
ncbi:MAG: nucleotide exchange factor GrpE [Candidatus Bathyarchaeota archaeon]|nr:nucleotide exchange factor GrpE [Candidatus Bathyarchaeota archaeon]